MSRWLSSVNNLLETLDGTAENVANDHTVIPTSRGAISQILSRRGTESDEDDDEDYDDDEEFEDDEYSNEDEDGDDEEEDEPEEVVDFSNAAETGSKGFATDPGKESASLSQLQFDQTQEIFPDTSKLRKTVQMKVPVAPPPAPSSGVLVSAGEESSDSTSDGAVMVKNPSEVESVTTEEPSSPPNKETSQKTFPLESMETQKPPLPPSSAPRSDATSILKSAPASGASIGSFSIEKMQQQLKKYKLEMKKSQSEARQLRKHMMQLGQELEASEAEVKAQQEELQRAAERMEKDRLRANEEREDLLDEQEEELENQKMRYENELQDQKARLEDQICDLQERLEAIEEKRMREGGDWTKEVEETLHRERESLKKLNDVKEENATLKSSVAALESQRVALRGKLDSLGQHNQAALSREREAQDKLDSALSLHSRQLSQRQAREAELEATVADLGAALANLRQAEKTPPANKNSASVSFKETYDMALDELESVRAQLNLETERSEALRKELSDVSSERDAELIELQARLRQQDLEIFDLKSMVSRLQASSRGHKMSTYEASEEDGDSAALQQNFEAAKQQVASLSEQVIQQQNAAQNSKQEILALKNRLQSATSRADAAENALATSTSNRNVFEIESGTAYGGASMRRRIKGGRSRAASTNVRSIRSSLGMNPGRVSGGMEQVAITIDAIDSFLIDTGSFMKQEPIARLGLVLYLCILHLWSFCLVAFHASSYEDVHGDFGSMNDPGGHRPLIRSQP